MHEPEESPLDLYSDQDLLTTLFRRYDHCAFIGRQDRFKGSGEDTVAHGYQGNLHTVMGLCFDSILRIVNDMKQKENEI